MKATQYYRDLLFEELEVDAYIYARHLKTIFNIIDVDQSGTISAEEFTEFLQDPELKKYIEAIDISAKSAEILFRVLDSDGSGSVDIDEFIEGCLSVRGP